MPRWRNGQTRYLEGVVPERAWGFKSLPRHQDRVHGRLAQLVERHVYTVEVRGSSPLSPTNASRPVRIVPKSLG